MLTGIITRKLLSFYTFISHLDKSFMKTSTHPRINHLGSRLERQQYFKLPLQSKIAELEKYTLLIQQTLEAMLPTETVRSLRVIYIDNHSLTISTDNHTTANHLNYMSQAILTLLHQAHPSFTKLERLKFRVVMLTHRFSQAANPPNLLQGNQMVNNVTSCELSELTKQNITQLTELVTSNKRLVQVLRKIVAAPKT